MKYIKYGTEFLDQLKDRVHDLYDENKELKQKVERLNNILIEIKEDIEDITSNYFKRYDDEVYKLCDSILEKIVGVDIE